MYVSIHIFIHGWEKILSIMVYKYISLGELSNRHIKGKITGVQSSTYTPTSSDCMREQINIYMFMYIYILGCT